MVGLRGTDALIAVDPQVDFLPGGALPVPRGDEVVPALNRWLDAFAAFAPGLRLPRGTVVVSKADAPARERARSQIASLPRTLRGLAKGEPYRVEVSPALLELTRRLDREASGLAGGRT